MRIKVKKGNRNRDHTKNENEKNLKKSKQKNIIVTWRHICQNNKKHFAQFTLTI